MINDLLAVTRKRWGRRGFWLVDSLPKPEDLIDPALKGILWLGTYGYNDAARLWFDKRKCFSHRGYWWTPGQLARDYLKAANIRPARITGAQLEIFDDYVHPMVALPGRYEDMVYVDLKAAYWSIMNIVGWGVDYKPGLWLGVRDSVSDFPFPDYKLGRNALVGTATLRGETRIFWKGQHQTRKTGNPYANSQLWGLIQDVLHGMAWYALTECEAVYINIDGAIMPAKHANQYMDFAAWHGLTAEVRHESDARIWSVGRYAIGDTKPAHPVTVERYHHNLNPAAADLWTLGKLRRFSKRL